MDLKKILDSIKSKSEFRKSVEVLGIKFELCVLSVDEEIKSNVLDPAINEDEGTAVYNTLKKNILSFSIRNVDGVEVPAVVEYEEGEGESKKVIKKERSLYLKEAIRDWNTQLVDSLFQVYIDVKDEAETVITKEIKYTWFKLPEKRRADLIDAITKKKEPEKEEEKKEVKDPEVNLKEVKVSE